MSPQSELNEIRGDKYVLLFLFLSYDSYLISLPVFNTTGSLVFLGLNSRDCDNNGNKTDQIKLRSHDPPPGQSDKDRV